MLALGTDAEDEQQVDEILSDTECLVAANSADAPPLPPPAEEPPQADGPFRRQRRTRTVKTNSAPSASSVAHSRSLKRRASDNKPPELLCMNRLCVWGKHVRAPAVVYPLTMRDGTLYMPIHERLFWLRRACDEKRGQTHWTAQFQHAVSKLRAAIRQGLRMKLDPAGTATETLRDALGLDSEGEDEEKGKKPVKRLAAPPSLAAVSLELSGRMVEVRVSERPFEVEATPEAVMAIIEFCQQSLQDSQITLKRDTTQRNRTSAPDPTAASHPGQASGSDVVSASASSLASHGGFRLAPLDCPPITGKVTWHPSVQAWCTHCKGDHGKVQWKRFWVHAPLQGGSFLDRTAGCDKGQGWAAARRAAYEAAVRFWNENDSSKRDRIELVENVELRALADAA